MTTLKTLLYGTPVLVSLAYMVDTGSYAVPTATCLTTLWWCIFFPTRNEK